MDIEKLNSLTSVLQRAQNDYNILANMNSEHFKEGNTLEIIVKSSLYGVVSTEKIDTYKSAKKYLTPMMEEYQNLIDKKTQEITGLIQGGDDNG